MKAKKLLAGILTAAMVFSSMALPVFAQDDSDASSASSSDYEGYTVYDLASQGSSIIIAEDKAVLKGASSNNVEVTIRNRDFSELILDNATGIKSIGMEYQSALYQYDDDTSGISFVLKGTNTITEQVKICGAIIITGDGATLTVGSQNAYNETGLGAYRVVINSGNVIAYGNSGRAAIGWWSCLVKITGGEVTATANGTGAAIGGGSYEDGNVTITGGKVTATANGTGAAIGGGKTSQGGGYVWITGGEVKAASNSGSAIGCGTNAGGDGWIVIEGGTVDVSSKSGNLLGTRLDEDGRHRMTITGGKFTTDVSAYLPECYDLVKNDNDNTYSVASKAAKIDETKYKTLAGAFEAAKDGDTVTLLDDVTLQDNIDLSKEGDITLDLGGNTLTHDGDNGPADGMIVLQNGANLEIKNGSIAVELVRDEKGEYKSGSQSSIDVGADSSLTVEDITLDAVAANSVFAAHDGGSIVIDGGEYEVTSGGVVVFAYGEGTKVEINGGTFTGTDESEGAVYAFNGANVTVNDGSFNFSDDETDYSAYGLAKGTGVNWLFCDYSGLIGYPFSGMNVRVASEADISVTGGTYNKDISSLGNLSWSREASDIKFASKKVNYLAKGKMLKDNNDGTYTVEDIEAKLNNTNVTTEEKVDTINSVVVNEAVAETIVKTIEKLPVDKQEEIAPTKVAEILGAVSSATTEDKVVTKKSTESGESETGQSTEGTVEVSVLKSVADTITITEKQATDDGAKEIKLPSSQTAKFFDVTLTKTTTTTTTGGGGSASETTTVTGTSVPVLLKFYVGENAANVKSVFRYHNGVQENLAFDRTDDGYILAASNKFSIVGYTFGTAITDGSAEITFEQDATNANVYNIYLKGAVDATVANFESGQFTIVNTASSGKVGMVLEGAKGDDGNNALLIIDEVAEGSYKIHRPNGAVDYPTVDTTNHKILLGTLTLTGTGKGQIYADNIKMYKKSTTDSLVDEISTTSDSVNYNITAETADLTVKVTFPNAVENQVAAYQDMKITISGGDLAEPLSYNLGSDASGNVVWSNTEDAVYTLTVADKLTQNVAYTVKVEGAGYRTARYTVNMTGAKTLNFWNNVKDTAVCVEDSAGTARKTTFLAGDIVKDNQINIYDLSAVVSYFGQTGIGVTQASNYAKYDLNRDGKIDSKDIAYVLVSWGN